MLVPYDLKIDADGEAPVMRNLLATAFSSAEEGVGWVPLAIRAHQDRRFVALILLDEGEASAGIRGELERRYHDLDRITGDVITVLTDARPPEDWFRRAAGELSRLPTMTQTGLRLSAHRLQTADGRQEAAANTRALLRESFDGADTMAPPVIVLLDLQPHTDGGYAISGQAFPLAPFAAPGKLAAALRLLTEIAGDARRRGEAVDAVTARAWSWTRWSLRWEGAVNSGAAFLVRLQKMWVPRI